MKVLGTRRRAIHGGLAVAALLTPLFVTATSEVSSADGVTAPKGTSYTASGGVKFASVIGIDLSVSRAYNDESVLSYKVGVDGRRMCGSDTYPGTAGKVMERSKR